jgi:hypothetical protein
MLSVGTRVGRYQSADVSEKHIAFTAGSKNGQSELRCVHVSSLLLGLHSIGMMETIRTSETSVCFYRPTGYMTEHRKQASQHSSRLNAHRPHFLNRRLYTV